MGWTALIVLILGSNISWSSAACPAPEVVSPCICRHETDEYGSGDSIICHGSSIKNLKMTFDQISENRKDGVRHFYKLDIRDTLIDHFESRLIGELTFDFIWLLDNLKLKKIHKLAFNHSASRVKYFFLTHSQLAPPLAPYNLFEMLNLFVNAKAIWIQNINLRKVPNKAIYNLENLVTLVFSYQPIDYISSNAFKFTSESKQTIRIYFHHCNLDSSSFSFGWYNNITRPVNIYISNNQITFLDQNVFQPFLDDKRNNQISSLARNPLNCSDCRNAWLEKQQVRNKYRTQVFDAHCGGKKENPTIFQSDFDHC